MPKYVMKRDHRALGGPKQSQCIDARNQAEAKADFEAHWQLKCKALGYVDEVTEREENTGPVQGAGDRLQVRTTKDIQAEAMTPAALAVKRNTRGIKK